MQHEFAPRSVAWLIDAIRRLPTDPWVPDRTPGYNRYNTQKDHWLGWLDPTVGTGTYPRRAGDDGDARIVYNHIVEPKMLLWLVDTAGVDRQLLATAQLAAATATSLPGKSAAIRKHVPWPTIVEALSKC